MITLFFSLVFGIIWIVFQAICYTALAVGTVTAGVVAGAVENNKRQAAQKTETTAELDKPQESRYTIIDIADNCRVLNRYDDYEEALTVQKKLRDSGFSVMMIDTEKSVSV